MNDFARALSVVLAAAAIAACSPSATDTHRQNPTAAATPPLQGAAIGGPFVLTDENGRTVHDTDFSGKYRIMYFGYTFCPDVCPVDMAHLGAAMRMLDESDPKLASKIQPIFVTVDPDRDTPAVLRAFTDAFYPRLLGLTGSADAIAKTAKEYAIWYKKQPPAPGGGYLVDHSRQAYLMSPDNKPLALLPVDGPPGGIVAEIERWAK